MNNHPEQLQSATPSEGLPLLLNASRSINWCFFCIARTPAQVSRPRCHYMCSPQGCNEA